MGRRKEHGVLEVSVGPCEGACGRPGVKVQGRRGRSSSVVYYGVKPDSENCALLTGGLYCTACSATRSGENGEHGEQMENLCPNSTRNIARAALTSQSIERGVIYRVFSKIRSRLGF